MVDLVFDTMCAHKETQEWQNIEWLVLDITDAFWTLGLRPRERRFFVGKLRGRYFVYNRLAQGSRGAPLAWCRFFALVGRLTLALFSKRECREQAYVDDPAFTITGSERGRRRTMAIIVLVWRCLNLELAFRKGQTGRKISWIGSTLILARSGVLATLQSDTVDELKALLSDVASANVVSIKALRSLAGKLCNAARLLTAWRPFLNDIWAALTAPTGNAPRGTVWVRQILPAVRWFIAFLQCEGALIMRPFLFQAYVLPASRIVFTLDASPWGYGGVLLEDGEFSEYFHAPVSQDDIDILGAKIGSADSQQLFESLAMLLALRIWKAKWHQFRSAVAVRGDNVTMLTMLVHFRGKSPALATVAREVALEVAGAAYRPVSAEHIPGVANSVADALSRMHAPSVGGGSPNTLPACLARCTRVEVPARPRAWYRALSCHVDPPAAEGIGEGSTEGKQTCRRVICPPGNGFQTLASDARKQKCAPACGSRGTFGVGGPPTPNKTRAVRRMNKCQVSPDVAFILQAAFLGCYGACHIAYDQNIVGQAPGGGSPRLLVVCGAAPCGGSLRSARAVGPTYACDWFCVPVNMVGREVLGLRDSSSGARRARAGPTPGGGSPRLLVVCGAALGGGSPRPARAAGGSAI